MLQKVYQMSNILITNSRKNSNTLTICFNEIKFDEDKFRTDMPFSNCVTFKHKSEGFSQHKFFREG